MDRISCNVLKDLLPPYLDQICSEESKGLVEEHLRECASCREFLEKLQGQDLEKDAPKADYLKKFRRALDLRSMLGALVPLVLIFVGLYRINQSFYYVEMPVLMFLYAFVWGKDRKAGMPVGKEWLLSVAGVAAVCTALGWRYRAFRMMQGALLPADVPLAGLGPYLHRQILAIAAGVLALLVVLVFTAQRKRRIFPVTQNLAWLGLNLVLSFDAELYSMAEVETTLQNIFCDTAILTVEFLVVTAISLLLLHKPRLLGGVGGAVTPA